MYELKKNWKGTYEEICWDWALVLLKKKNLPGRDLTKVEKHWPIECRKHRCSFLCWVVVVNAPQLVAANGIVRLE